MAKLAVGRVECVGVSVVGEGRGLEDCHLLQQ